ncbi:MAG: hypothetical protein OHK0046_30420 [Anaerolineae bacterium]
MLKKLEEKVWHKEWTQEDLHKYVGYFEDVYFTYATDPDIRSKAASGGTTSGLLVYLLETGQVDGVLVLRTVIKEGKARPEFFIATTREEVLSARGSKYSAVYFTRDAFPLIKAFDGRIAMVALPCDAMITHNYRAKDPEFDKKIKYVFTLLCGHNSEPELTDAVVDRIRPSSNVELMDYAYRTGHWRGELKATFSDGTEVTRPFSHFSDYRNVYFFAQKKCHHCFDHFGYYCDLSMGDIWSPQMRNNPVKHTAVIVRTPEGRQLLEAAIAAGAIHGEKERVEDVVNGQARTAPFHYNISARSKVGRLFGMKIKDHTREKVRWNDAIVAGMALLDQRVTSTALGRKLVLMMPRPVLKAYLYLLKGLESL